MVQFLIPFLSAMLISSGSKNIYPTAKLINSLELFKDKKKDKETDSSYLVSHIAETNYDV